MKRPGLKRKLEKSDIISLAAIGLLLALFVFIGMEYVKTFGASGSIPQTAENMKAMIQSYGSIGVVVFVLMHVLQVVVSAIPGSAMQFVGGAIYGLWGGMATAQVGILLGSLVSFNLSRLLGRRIVTLFVSESAIEKIDGAVSKSTSTWVMLAMFVMPGFPKDFLSYVVGLTGYKQSKFHVISAIGRLPGMFVSTYLGVSITSGGQTMLIVVTSVTCLLFLLMWLFKDKLYKFIMDIQKKDLGKK